MERSFAEGVRYGLKRARWRGLWRVRIQDYLIATVQNVMLLVRHGNPGLRVVMADVNAAMKALKSTAKAILHGWRRHHLPAVQFQLALSI